MKIIIAGWIFSIIAFSCSAVTLAKGDYSVCLTLALSLSLLSTYCFLRSWKSGWKGQVAIIFGLLLNIYIILDFISRFPYTFLQN